MDALEPTEESDAVEVLATWKHTRTAMNQEKLNRGLRTPVYQHSNRTSITRNFLKPDLAQLAGRSRSFKSRKVGRICPNKRAQSSGEHAGVRAVSCNQEPTTTAYVFSTHESDLEKLVRGTVEAPLIGTKDAFGRRSPWSVSLPRCAVPHILCAKTLVGQSALKRHVEVGDEEPRCFQTCAGEVQGIRRLACLSLCKTE